MHSTLYGPKLHLNFSDIVCLNDPSYNKEEEKALLIQSRQSSKQKIITRSFQLTTESYNAKAA